MALGLARRRLGLVFLGRCFWLFLVLLSFVAVVPFIEPTPLGRIVVGAANAFVVIAAVATVGRSALSFVIALLLGLPAFAFQLLAYDSGDVTLQAYMWAFSAALYAVTIAYLLRYVFSPDVMTADKLWGAAAVYLMMGVFWTFLYALVGRYYPPAFAQGGTPGPVEVVDLLYFSFTTLTSTGYGDIVPVARQARALCAVEQLAGALYLAILIARLAGVYPPYKR